MKSLFQHNWCLWINGRWKVTTRRFGHALFTPRRQGRAWSFDLVKGRVVPVAAIPDCTGTSSRRTDAGLPVVDYTKPCKPWSSFIEGELRGY